MLEARLSRKLATIDLNVRLALDAEVLALFGPSGSGKSMTLKLIAGIEKPDSGLVRSGNRTLYDSSARVNQPPQRRHIGYVPQHYALFPHMTALENIAFPLQKGLGWSRQRAVERARELLETFGLPALAETLPLRLSGGQQQRVAIARALAGEPEVLLLDEPFAALDAPTREDLREEFRLIQGRLDIPVLLVTHDLEEAATLASRMAVIVDGRIEQSGDTRDVLDHPVSRRVAELIRSRNILAGTVRNDTVQTVPGTIPAGDLILPDGANVDVVIRPESIRVLPADAVNSQNDVRFEGIVTDLIDHGTRIAVLLTVNTKTLEANLSPTESRRLELHPGMPVRIEIHPEDVHVIEVRA